MVSLPLLQLGNQLNVPKNSRRKPFVASDFKYDGAGAAGAQAGAPHAGTAAAGTPQAQQQPLDRPLAVVDATEPAAELARLSYPEGQAYRGLWYSRGNKPPYPNTTKNDPRRLLMRVNAWRFEDGKRSIGLAQLRRLVSSLRDKGYLEFRPNRRRRNPRGKIDGFRRGSFVAIIGPAPHELEYLERGHGTGQTHYLARLDASREEKEKCSLEAPPQNMFVGGHEVTDSPPKQQEQRSDRERASRSPDSRQAIHSREIIAHEKHLTELATIVSERFGTPWRKEAERTKALFSIKRAFDEGASRTDLEVVVVGTASNRAGAIEKAKARGELHPFWEQQSADVVAKAASYFYRKIENSRGYYAPMVEGIRQLGVQALLNLYDIDATAPGFAGIELTELVEPASEPAPEHHVVPYEPHELGDPFAELFGEFREPAQDVEVLPSTAPAPHVHHFDDKPRLCRCHEKRSADETIHPFDEHGRCTVPVVVRACACGIEGCARKAVPA